MVTIFTKFKNFWVRFWNNFKEAYNRAVKDPVDVVSQAWRDVDRINFLSFFVGKLNNLCNTEATFEVKSDSTQADRLKELAKDLEDKRFDITGGMLGDGDFYVFPSTNERGELIHSLLSQQQVRIIAVDGDEIREAYGIIDWYIDKKGRTYYLLRKHKL